MERSIDVVVASRCLSQCENREGYLVIGELRIMYRCLGIGPGTLADGSRRVLDSGSAAYRLKTGKAKGVDEVAVAMGQPRKSDGVELANWYVRSW